MLSHDYLQIKTHVRLKGALHLHEWLLSYTFLSGEISSRLTGESDLFLLLYAWRVWIYAALSTPKLMFLIYFHKLRLHVFLDMFFENIWSYRPSLLIINFWVKVVASKYFCEKIIDYQERHLLTLRQKVRRLVVLDHVINFVFNEPLRQFVIWIKIDFPLQFFDNLWVSNRCCLGVLKKSLEQWLITA